MKTIAARFDDQLFEILALVAKLEETSVVDQIRTAVEAHLAHKMAEGDLASRAQAAVDEIDREAAAKKAAIAGLVNTVTEKAPAKTTPRRRGKSGNGGPTATEPQARAIGYGPARQRRGGS